MRRIILPALAASALLVTGCAGATTPAVSTPTATTPAAPMSGASPTASAAAPVASADLTNAAGASVGMVTITAAGTRLHIEVTGRDLEPGFHGLHLHAIGTCEPNSPDPADAAKVGNFNSSGGHLAGSGEEHPEHAGDLPVLLIGADGTGSVTADTDRVTREEILDADGTALVVHAQDDNYANIPTRYATPGADAETKKAGDAGARIACAALK